MDFKDENYTFYKFLKDIFIKLLYIIIVPIIIYDIFIILQTIANPEEVPSLFGIKIFTITSGSMEPTIGKDDVIFVKKCTENDIYINDIITFKVNKEMITHRVIESRAQYEGLIYTTQGDSNEVSDVGKVNFSQVEGKYIGRIPKIGIVFNILKNKFVFSIGICVLIITFFFNRAKEEKKEKRRERREKRLKFENKK